MLRVVESSGGPVSWDVATGNVACCNAADTSGSAEERADILENGVDRSVAMPADAPALHDAGVVSVEYDVVAFGKDGVESADKELKGDGFGPSDVFGSLFLFFFLLFLFLELESAALFCCSPCLFMALSLFFGIGLSLIFPVLNAPGVMNGPQGSEDFYGLLFRLTVDREDDSFVIELWECVVWASFSSGICHGLDAE